MTKLSDSPKEKYKSWYYTEVGHRIKTIRELRGDTQEALADCLGISRVAMNCIENGKQRLPLYLIHDIANLLNATLNEIAPTLEECRLFKHKIYNNANPLNK